MKKKRKLTPEFWERDAASRRELEARIAAIDARLKQRRDQPDQRDR
jgi:hypothetical protein